MVKVRFKLVATPKRSKQLPTACADCTRRLFSAQQRCRGIVADSRDDFFADIFDILRNSAYKTIFDLLVVVVVVVVVVLLLPLLLLLLLLLALLLPLLRLVLLLPLLLVLVVVVVVVVGPYRVFDGGVFANRLFKITGRRSILSIICHELARAAKRIFRREPWK